MKHAFTTFAAAAVLFLAACADPTGGGGSGGGSGGSSGASASRGNARAMSVSNNGVAVVAQSYGGVESGSYYNYTGNLQVSTDSGSTWTSVGDPAVWTKVRVSADGTKMVAMAGAGGGAYSMTSGPAAVSQAVYSSTDGGTTWQWATGLPTKYYYGMQASPDGSQVVVSSSSMSGNVHYLSSDSGATFTALSLPSTSPLSGQTISSITPVGISNTHLYVTASYSVSSSIKNTLFAIPHGSFATGSAWVNIDPASTGSPPNTTVRNISAADDGNTVLAIDNTSGSNTKLYLGTLSGGAFTFSELTSLEASVLNYQTATLSSDGTQIFLVARGAISGSTYPPTYGAGSLKKAAVGDTSWTTLSAFGSQPWSLLAISPDGNRILASDGSPAIKRSTDGGTTVASHTFNNFSAGSPGTPPSMGSGGVPSGGGGSSGGGSGSGGSTLTGNGLVTSGYGTSGIVNLSTQNLAVGGQLVSGPSGTLYGLFGGTDWTSKYLIKLSSLGMVDSGFATNGKYTFSAATIGAALGITDAIGNLTLSNLTTDDAGGVYVNGYVSHGASGSITYATFVAKYTSTGAVDTSFGTSGYLDVTSELPRGGGSTLVRQASGTVLILVGYTGQDIFKAAKISSSGTVVGSFLNVYSSFQGLNSAIGWWGVKSTAVGTDGSVYILSSNTNNAFMYSGSTPPASETAGIVKLTVDSSGVALASWGTSGAVGLDLQSIDSGKVHRIVSLAVDGSNQVLFQYTGFVTASGSNSTWWDTASFGIKRLSSSGTLDNSYSVAFPANTYPDSASLTVLNGNLYVAGTTTTGSAMPAGFIQKFNASTGAAVTSFGTSGKLVPVTGIRALPGLMTDGTNLWGYGTVTANSGSVNAVFKVAP